MKSSSLIFLAALAIVAQGCSHAVEKRVDAKLAQEDVQDRSALRSEVEKQIDTAPGLSDSQRQALRDLHIQATKEGDEIHQNSIKLRALLVKEVISENYDSDEVSVIKHRLHKLEDRRLSLLFKTVEKANTILGHQAPSNAKLMHAIFRQHGAHSE